MRQLHFSDGTVSTCTRWVVSVHCQALAVCMWTRVRLTNEIFDSGRPTNPPGDLMLVPVMLKKLMLLNEGVAVAFVGGRSSL